MKKTLYILSLIAISAGFIGCTKKTETPPAPSTALHITTTDALGNKLNGSVVTLYTSQTDWKNKTNPVASGITNAMGGVFFDSLSPLQYYWSAVMECKNNEKGSVTTTTPIPAHSTTTITTVLAETGTLKYVNNSVNPYSIYINGELAGTVAGSSTSYSANMPVGNYVIRVLQNSGYLVTPTDITFNGSLTCGITLTMMFP